MPKAKPESPDRECTQVERFKNLARELEADEDEAKFEETVKRLAKAPTAEPKKD